MAQSGVRRSTWGDAHAVGVVVALKIAASALALFGGFRAVSDDDFARVVIAEAWAHAPRFDASGTSWLPFPFWITGAVMGAVGRGLEVARGAAFALGIGAAMLTWIAARWLGAERRAAMLGAMLAAVIPWSARLGVATVPELPTAALALLALASLGTSGDEGSIARRRLGGGLALLASTLSRYEVWPLALGFAALTLVDLRRYRGARVALLVAASLALLGPALWVAWNQHAHGDPLHFVARVTAYRRALGGDDDGALARLGAYPVALLRGDPELLAVGALALLAALSVDRAAVTATLARFARPLALVLAQVALLALAMIKDGAPTHHPERALLTLVLLLALAIGELAAIVARGPARRAGALAIVGAALVVGIATRVRPTLASEGVTPRTEEVAAGALGRSRVPAGAKVLIEVSDYGYLAVIAALGRPEDAVSDRSIDPRDPAVASSFTDASALRARASAAGVSFVLGRATTVTRDALGQPTDTVGPWALWKVPPSTRESGR